MKHLIISEAPGYGIWVERDGIIKFYFFSQMAPASRKRVKRFLKKKDVFNQ